MGADFKPPFISERKPLQELLPLDQPLGLYIDSCDVCNFKCDFCFQKYRNIAGCVLDKKLFNKIINDMKEFEQVFKIVHLYNFGEPLINKDIAVFVKALKKNKLAEVVQITTNGSLLTEQMSRELVDAGLDGITFSIYGLDDEAYMEFTSTQVSFDRLVDNIRFFYSVRGRCKVHVKIVGNYFDEAQKKEFLNLFEDIADTYYIDNAANSWPDLTTVKDTGDKHIYGILEAGVERICPQPFYQMIIHSDGMVSPCCVDYDKKVIMGDVRKESLKEIWNGQRYRELRKKLLLGNLDGEIRCKNCNFPTSGATVDITPYKEDIFKKYNWD